MSVAQELIVEAIASVQSIARLSGKVLQAYNEEDLFNGIRGVVLPAVGIVYGGMQSTADNSPTEKTGLSGICTMNFIVLASGSTLGASGVMQSYAIETLDELRQEFLDKRSSSGHKWRFVSEAQIGDRNKTAVWLQRWTVPVQFTKKK